MYDDKVNRVRCDTCGKFMRYQESGSSYVFVPCSDAPTYEEISDQCKKCTDKYGVIIPRQNVVTHLCNGVYK